MAIIKLIYGSEEREVLSYSTYYYSPKPYPWGGIINLTMASTDRDNFFYEAFKEEAFHNGRIEIYNAVDDDLPFRRIEFWDAWIVEISEEMDSVSGMPMLLHCKISPATARYNKRVVLRKSWYMTDIDMPAPIYKSRKEERILVNGQPLEQRAVASSGSFAVVGIGDKVLPPLSGRRERIRNFFFPRTFAGFPVDAQGVISGPVQPIMGIAPAPGKGGVRAGSALTRGGQTNVRTLQTGGNTLNRSTLRELGLTREQGNKAIHALKRAEGILPNQHGKIMSNGNYVLNGIVRGNLFHFLP